jgi:hypothetical protein
MDPSELLERLAQTLETLRVAVGRDVTFASPEDVIIKKLAFYREGGSEKHLRDISGVLKVMGNEIDRAYIERWVQRLGLTREWSTFARE